MKLSVSEVFYSIQGEGSTMGIPSVFMRLGGCNLMCGGIGTQNDKELHNDATWRCDTIEVWMKSKRKSFEDILSDENIEHLKNRSHLIITGGEPLLHQTEIIQYLNWFYNNYCFLPFVEIETNGTIAPLHELNILVAQYNCSPKLSNSGNTKNIFYNITSIKSFPTKKTIFKFVVSHLKDWEEIKELYLPLIKKEQVWLMPAGENQTLLNENKKLVADICKDNYLKYTTRLHIEIWNQKTGV
jgi:organic radical activating enzyme